MRQVLFSFSYAFQYSHTLFSYYINVVLHKCGCVKEIKWHCTNGDCSARVSFEMKSKRVRHSLSERTGRCNIGKGRNESIVC